MPIERTVDWLCDALRDLPTAIKMVYVDSGEYYPPGPKQRPVANFDLFGFEMIPDGRFDPDNQDHVASLGEWDWEARTSCDFPAIPFEEYVWLDVLESAVYHPALRDVLKKKNVLLLFADHDGPINMIR